MTVVSDYRALLSNTSWTTGQSGDAVIVTYSFLTAPTPDLQASSPTAASTFHAPTEDEKATIRAALAQYAAISGITFEETKSTPGDITFGFYNLTTLTGSTGIAGEGNFPQTGTLINTSGVPQVSSTFSTTGGDVYFDNAYQTNPTYFSDFAHVAIHEIGHALGLKHPFDPAPTGTSYTLTTSLDNGAETVMSYTGIRASTLGPLDIGAIQYMYGTPTTAKHPFIQIWSALTEGMTVIGSATVAQSLFGSGGNDVFYSPGQHDALSGGQGNDTFYLDGAPAGVNGGGGTDTVFTGLVYSTTATAVTGTTARETIYLPGYADYQTFINVATLVFTNGVYTTATNTFTPYDAAAYAAKAVSITTNNGTTSLVSGTAILGAVKGNVVSFSGSGTVFTNVGGIETIKLGSGPSAVSGSGQDTIFGGAGFATVIAGAGADTVVGGAGAMTVHGGSGNSVVFSGTGGLTYIGNTGNDIVVGNGTPVTIVGGTGQGTYFGGGNSTITGGVGAQSVLVGTNGDTLYSAGSAGDLFGALGANVTMSGINSSGNDVFFGAAGTGTLNFITGSGNDLLGLGQGTNVVILGAGHSTVFANTSTTAVSTITAGSGSADIGLGGKSVNLAITAIPAGATRAFGLYNFVPGADKITLFGYDPSAAATAIAAQKINGSGTLLQLSDQTAIQLVGVSHADSSLFG